MLGKSRKLDLRPSPLAWPITPHSMRPKLLSWNGLARRQKPIPEFAPSLRGCRRISLSAAREMLAYLARAYAYKQIGDYAVGPGASITPKLAEDAIEGAEQFIERTAALLGLPRSPIVENPRKAKNVSVARRSQARFLTLTSMSIFSECFARV